MPAPTESEGEIAVEKLEEGVVSPTVSALKKLSALRPHADALGVGGLAKTGCVNFISLLIELANDEYPMLVVQRLGDAAALYSQAGVDIAPTPKLKDKGGELKAIVDGAFLR